MIERAEYVQILKDLLSRDPSRVRDANRRLYLTAVVELENPAEAPAGNREADLVLAEVAS
jgi:hypothetical protein